MEFKIYIESVYEYFKLEISKEKRDDLIITSLFSLLIDIHGMALLIDFFNDSKDIDQRSHLFVIKMLNIITYEALIYIEKLDNDLMFNYNTDNMFLNLKKFRHNIHQFEYSKFSQVMEEIEQESGRSYNHLEPMLDIVVYYRKTNRKYLVEGTNTNLFKFGSSSLQNTVNRSQEFIRSLDVLVCKKNTPPKIEKANKNENIMTLPYSFVAIMKSTKIKNNKLLNRLIFALDDLSEIDHFYNNVISIDSYLLESPYVIYFFLKLIYIQLDETISNLSNFVKNSPRDCTDRKQIELILENIELDFKKRIKTFRNNLHYENQSPLNIGNETETLRELKSAILFTNDLKIEICELLNIKLTKRKILINSFLHWVQV